MPSSSKTAMNYGICRVVAGATEDAPATFTLNPSKVVVTEPKKLNKGKFCNVKYAGGPLYLESPMLHSPMGCSTFEDASKKTLFLSCRGHEDDPGVRAFVDGVQAFQDVVVDRAAAMGLIGEGRSRQTVAETMSPFLKPSDTYPPAIRVTLPFSGDGEPQFDTYRLKGSKMVACAFDDVDLHGASVKVIFSITCVWVVNKNWGVSAKATQILVKPSFDVPSSGVCCFSDLAIGEDDEDDDDAADDDDEEDDADEGVGGGDSP